LAGGSSFSKLQTGARMQNAGPFALALVVALAACGGGDGGTPPPSTPVFTSLLLSPSSPALVFRDTLQMSATPRDQNGAEMSNLPAATYELVAGSGNAVTVSPNGRVVAVATGSSQIRASLTSGGTTRTVTATVTVRALDVSPTVTASGAGATFSPDTVKIAVNGNVTWSFPGPETHNVTFQGAAPPGGNIADRNSGTEPRQFPAAGRFSYICTRHAGMNGAVVVRTP
jgi:plastocyanin